jgi:hypothetical protein
MGGGVASVYTICKIRGTCGYRVQRRMPLPASTGTNWSPTAERVWSRGSARQWSIRAALCNLWFVRCLRKKSCGLKQVMRAWMLGSNPAARNINVQPKVGDPRCLLETRLDHADSKPRVCKMQGPKSDQSSKEAATETSCRWWRRSAVAW